MKRNVLESANLEAVSLSAWRFGRTHPKTAIRIPGLLLAGLLLFAGCGESEQQSSTKEEPSGATPAILFLGDSLTAGLGLEKYQAAPALIQEKIDARGWKIEVINGGVSGDTTAGGLSRLDFYFKNRKNIAFLVIGLGSNDGMRGIGPGEIRSNLNAIVDRAREHNPDIVIFLYELMTFPNMGPQYASDFQKIFPEVARKQNLHLIAFPLQGVAGKEDLNQKDGIHPTVEGTKIMAANIWKDLEPVLENRVKN
ncbi:MAG: arylesterase [Leptospiraceae bacterium]|nr:arylesterase [Leptospiraceae bacterium]